MKKEYVYPQMKSSKIRTSILCGSGGVQQSIEKTTDASERSSLERVDGKIVASARTRSSLGF